MPINSKALATLAAAKNDLVATKLHFILKNWLNGEVGFWERGIETAYDRNGDEIVIGLFSNLPAKLGERPDESPFFLVEVSRAPNRPVDKCERMDFGLNEYFGEHLNDVSPMLVPFLTYAIVLRNEHKSKLISLETGDWKKNQPLVVTFKLPKQRIKLAINGHILVKEATMIKAVKHPVAETA